LVIFFLIVDECNLADFGESRLFAGNVKWTVTPGIGTYMYMAPELLDDKKKFFFFFF
jgi:serine/threonine protein kinase